MRHHHLVASTALLISAALLPLCTLEIALRVRESVPAAVLGPDSILLYKPVPGSHKKFRHRAENGGHVAHTRMNSDGFRGPALRAKGEAFRVMVYGDSFINGEFADDSGTFVRMLERLLSRERPTEVINAGVVGWGPDQAFLRMRQELHVYEPSLVVLAVFADNDMGDLLRNRLVRPGPDSTLELRRPVLHPRLNQLLSAQANPSGLRSLHLTRWVERKLGRTRETVLPATRKKNGPASMATYDDFAMANAVRQWEEFQTVPDTVIDLLNDSYDIDISATPEAPSARYKVTLMDRLLGTIRRDFSARKLPFVLVIIPSPLDVCDTYDVRIDSTKYPGHEPRRVSGIIDSLAARHGMRRIDLWDAFRANDPCGLYYRKGDLHWNGKGQAVAASLLADSLAAWRNTAVP